MTINGRIKQLRKQLKLSQTEFGERIGLKNSAVSKMEQEGSTVVEQNVHLICQTYGISEQWLRDGVGEMMSPAAARKSELLTWAEKLEQDDADTFPRRLADALSRLTPSEWELLEKIADKIAADRPAYDGDIVLSAEQNAACPARGECLSDDAIASRTDIKRKIVLAELADEEKANEK